MLMIIIIIQLKKRQSFDRKNLVIKNGNGILQYDSLSGLRFASKSGKGGRMRLLNEGFTKQK
ncbi:hypothetical protein AWI50_01155 [Salmonella enterica]|nr:hypothetical protein AWI50_01155 [Salmonella enterica]